MKNCLKWFFLSMMMSSVYADTIERYMDVVNTIPKMEMKADPDSQVWVRSARNIITLTCESIAETLIAANKTSTEQGKPLFCFNGEKGLQSEFLNTLIQTTYKDSSAPLEVKNSMTVSEIALLGLIQKYPCTPDRATFNTSSGFSSPGAMAHVSH